MWIIMTIRSNTPNFPENRGESQFFVDKKPFIQMFSVHQAENIWPATVKSGKS